MKTKFLLLVICVLFFKTAHAADKVPTMYGADVSTFQGEIDWDTVYDNIDYAILRCGYGGDFSTQDDKRWERNANECTRLGIPFGVYLYSYADTVEKAEDEAKHVLRLVKGYNLCFPIYYDIEDKIQLPLSAAELGDIAKTFCDIIEDAGYEVGIYASTYWWNNYLTDPIFETKSWYKWVAQYNVRCTYPGAYTMWQYTSEGEIDGIIGNVDMNYWYGSLRGVTASKVKDKLNPTATPKPTATPAPTATPKPTATPSPTAAETVEPLAPTPSAPASTTEQGYFSDIFVIADYGGFVELQNISGSKEKVTVIITSYEKGKLCDMMSSEMTFIPGKKQRFKMTSGTEHKVYIYDKENGMEAIFE